MHLMNRKAVDCTTLELWIKKLFPEAVEIKNFAHNRLCIQFPEKSLRKKQFIHSFHNTMMITKILSFIL